MFMVLLVLGVGLVVAFWFLPRGRRESVTSTDPGGTFVADGGSSGGADCSSPSDAGCSDGGGGDGGGGGGD